MEIHTAGTAYTLQAEPLTKVLTTAPGLCKGELRAAQFGGGVINIARLHADLPPKRFKTAALASLGMENQEISKALGCSWHTVNDHLRRAYTSLGVSSRGGIARQMFANKAFTIFRPGSLLGITDEEQPIVELFSYGLTRNDVAAELKLSTHYVRSRLDAVADRHNLRGKQDVVLAAMLSGEIGDFALQTSSSNT